MREPEQDLRLGCSSCKSGEGVLCAPDCEAKAWAGMPPLPPLSSVRPAPAPKSQPEISERGAGLKFDGGKPRWNLLMAGMPAAVLSVVQVLSFGAQKYEAHSWRQVENGLERYTDALYRHLNAYATGEVNDPESGLPHLAHALTNLMFILELEKANAPH